MHHHCPACGLALGADVPAECPGCREPLFPPTAGQSLPGQEDGAGYACGVLAVVCGVLACTSLFGLAALVLGAVAVRSRSPAARRLGDVGLCLTLGQWAAAAFVFAAYVWFLAIVALNAR